VASLLPNSPRARRRLIVAAAVLVAAGAAVLVVLLIPNNHGGIASSSGTETVQLVKRQKQIRVTSRMRASINALFDQFVPRAVARQDPASVRPFVTANLWRQATPAEWRAGSIPVPPYDPAGRTFHGWRTIYAFPRTVRVELTLEPKRARDPVGSFVVGLKRVGSRWLVDGIYAEGTHGGESAAAPAVTTTAAATTTEHVVGGSRGRLSDVWLLVPLGLLSLIVIVPAVVFTGQWVNDRRVRRRDRDNPAKQLPPLPRRDPR
jgi:hypothetical protein